MKIKRFLALLLLLALLPCFSACAQEEPSATEPPPDPAAQQPAEADDIVRLAFATGTASGTYYPFGSILAEAIRGHSGYIYAETFTTEASLDNIRLLANGEAQLAIVQNDILDYAFHGTQMFTTPETNLATLATLYPENCQLVVAADSGITKMAELEGKTVSLGDPDSGVSANALQILEAHGLDTEKITPQYLDFNHSAEALKNHEIDAFFITAGTPNAAVMDLQANANITLISLEEEAMTALLEKYPFYTRATLTAQDYSFLAEDVQTVAVRATLVCSKELDEQVAYDIVKAIMEETEMISTSHVKGMFIDPNYAIAGISVDLHPGAARYYQEINAGATPAGDEPAADGTDESEDETEQE